MTARKPKPRKAAVRKGSWPTLEQRVADIEAGREFDQDWLEEIDARLKSMEARAHFRDASHDVPVSNANETVCASGTLVAPLTPPAQSWWRRFLDHMGSA